MQYGVKEITPHRQMVFAALNLSMKNNVPKVTLSLSMGLTASRRCDTDRETIPVWKPQAYPLSVSSYWQCTPQKQMEGTALHFLWLYMESNSGVFVYKYGVSQK